MYRSDQALLVNGPNARARDCDIYFLAPIINVILAYVVNEDLHIRIWREYIISIVLTLQLTLKMVKDKDTVIKSVSSLPS